MIRSFGPLMIYLIIHFDQSHGMVILPFIACDEIILNQPTKSLFQTWVKNFKMSVNFNSSKIDSANIE